MRTDAFGYASGLWQDGHDMLDCGKTELGFARLVHFLALAYIVYHSGLTGLMRRTRAFLPLCLIGRYSLPVFATGTVLSAMGEVQATGGGEVAIGIDRRQLMARRACNDVLSMNRASSRATRFLSKDGAICRLLAGASHQPRRPNVT